MDVFFQIIVRIAAAILIFGVFTVFRILLQEAYGRFFTDRQLVPDSLTQKERDYLIWLGVPFILTMQIFICIFGGILMAAIPFGLTESIVSRAFLATSGAGIVYAIFAGLQFLMLFLPYSEKHKPQRNRLTAKGFVMLAFGCFITLTLLRWIFVEA